jgi:hypothetical protein
MKLLQLLNQVEEHKKAIFISQPIWKFKERKRSRNELIPIMTSGTLEQGNF